jgi:hypothetical protein
MEDVQMVKSVELLIAFLLFIPSALAMEEGDNFWTAAAIPPGTAPEYLLQEKTLGSASFSTNAMNHGGKAESQTAKAMNWVPPEYLFVIADSAKRPRRKDTSASLACRSAALPPDTQLWRPPLHLFTVRVCHEITAPTFYFIVVPFCSSNFHEMLPV